MCTVEWTLRVYSIVSTCVQYSVHSKCTVHDTQSVQFSVHKCTVQCIQVYSTVYTSVQYSAHSECTVIMQINITSSYLMSCMSWNLSWLVRVNCLHERVYVQQPGDILFTWYLWVCPFHFYTNRVYSWQYKCKFVHFGNLVSIHFKNTSFDLMK